MNGTLVLPPALGGQAIAFSTDRLEREARVQLNLTPSSYGGEYSADVFGEITCGILENGVSVASQAKGTLRVARHCKIRMIEQIVGFHSNCDLLAFRQLKALLQRHIKLREPRSAQDISPCITKLAGGRQRKGTRIKPAGRTAYVTAVWTNAFVRIAGEVWPSRIK